MFANTSVNVFVWFNLIQDFILTLSVQDVLLPMPTLRYVGAYSRNRYYIIKYTWLTFELLKKTLTHLYRVDFGGNDASIYIYVCMYNFHWVKRYVQSHFISYLFDDVDLSLVIRHLCQHPPVVSGKREYIWKDAFCLSSEPNLLASKRMLFSTNWFCHLNDFLQS